MTEVNGRHVARKRFGQHFLHDSHVIETIVAAIDPKPGQHLVEIGPGLGALTCPLLALLGELDVVELDRDVIPRLRENCASLGTLHVYEEDVLKFDFSQLVRAGHPLRVVGNLPYNISTPLLFRLLQQKSVVQDMHFMVQKEVAHRLVATPGNKRYGRLSVMVQYHCEVTCLVEVGSGAFLPAPKVDSTFIRMQPHARVPVNVGDEKIFTQVVRQAFSQRRKTLRNTLKGLLSPQQLLSAGVDPGQRAENLTLAQFAALSEALTRANN